MVTAKKRESDKSIKILRFFLRIYTSVLPEGEHLVFRSELAFRLGGDGVPKEGLQRPNGCLWLSRRPRHKPGRCRSEISRHDNRLPLRWQDQPFGDFSVDGCGIYFSPGLPRRRRTNGGSEKGKYVHSVQVVAPASLSK